MLQALNQTLKEEFRHNPDTYIWGQDVANKDKGGIFNITKGLQQEFGKSRVFNGPIAEDFIVGTADGFSRFSDKIRVVVEGAEFADYFWPAAEQLIELSHDYWRSNGQFCPNVTVRLASGGYIGGGLYHSQNLEGWLTTIPGIRVVVPAFADDAAGLLRTCLRSRGVTLYLEPKFLYNSALAKARRAGGLRRALRQGPGPPRGQATSRILAYGTPGALRPGGRGPAGQGGHRGRGGGPAQPHRPWTRRPSSPPCRRPTACSSPTRTRSSAASAARWRPRRSPECFPWLDAPVERVGSEFTPVGFNRILERAILPNAEKVLAAARKVLAF